MKQAALLTAAALAIAYVLVCGALYAFQRSLIYFPPPATRARGADVVALQVDGARVFVTTRERPGKKAVVYFGGNAEDVGLSLPDVAAAFPDRAVYMLHYRGYGGSTGEPSESANVGDALALVDKVARVHPEIMLVGRSLGSGVAVQVASQRKIERLVLVTPFDSAAEIAAGQFPYLPVRWLLKDKYESWKFAPRITVPTLVIAAEHDEVIPRVRTDALVRHFPHGVATLTVLPAVGHNTISASSEYVSVLGYTK